MPHDDGGDDPVWDRVHKRFTVVGDNRPLVFRPARLPDPATIPPRPWLYGTQLLRDYVTVLIAPGGVGKTGYAMGVGLALATGQPIFEETIFDRVKVAVLNLEDPMDELERRLAALMIHHNVKREEVEDRYFLYSSDDRKVVIAAPSDDGYDVVHPDEQAIIREIQENGIGALVVDPFAESHSLEENSNGQMVKAAAAWRRIARATNCSVFLIHHVRKGAAADIDAARGAKALTDSARVGLLLSAMTEEEAEEFDIPPEERTRYVRLDDAKANMAPRAAVARWFRLATVPLGNATPAYPNGDHVAALGRWTPPSAMGDLTTLQLNQALDAIDKGPREGVRYTDTNSGKVRRWAGDALIELFGVSERRAATMVKTWVREGALEVRVYRDSEQRKDVHGLFVNPTRRPGTEVG